MPEPVQTRDFDEDYKNPRGIPRVQFIEDCAEYVKTKGLTVETILQQFQEHHSKYKLMETKLQQTKNLLSGKLPEIRKTLDTVAFLQAQKEAEATFDTHFGLTDSVFCEAVVKAPSFVHLWLGANVMVQYPMEEAVAVLQKNLDSASTNLETTLEDLAWLKDQVVILQVNISRVYNFDVVRRRDEKK
jgi:prefoldin subunit 5